MSSNLPNRVLIIDDDQMVLNQVETMLSSYKIQSEKANNLETALYLFNTKKFDAVIIEMEFEELPGTVITQKFRESEFDIKKDIPIIISSGIQRDGHQSALMSEIGDVTLLSKPIQTGKLLSALNSCTSVASNRAKLSHVLTKVIEPLQKQGKHEKAMNVAKSKLIDLDHKGKFETALIMEKAGEIDEAVQALKELSSDDSNNMRYINALARMYMSLGDLEKAKLYYEKADKIAPDNLARITEMAGLYLSLKEPVKSIEKYTRLLELHPEKPDMKFEIYQELFEGGFEQHARDLCKQTSTPLELIRHFNNKGVMLSKESKFEEAIAEYQKARNLIPESKQLYRILYNMAIGHMNLKTKPHIEKAHELLLEVLSLDPS